MNNEFIFYFKLDTLTFIIWPDKSNTIFFFVEKFTYKYSKIGTNFYKDKKKLNKQL